MRSAAVNKSRNLWVESTVAGFERLSRSRAKDAARCWLEADAALGPEQTEFESLAAASRSNAGVARLLLGHEHEAGQCFEAAEQSWQNVIADVAALDVPIGGASSSFHFRLAAKAPDILTSIQRERYRRLAEAARAITQFNRTLIRARAQDLAQIDQRASALRATLRDLLGYGAPEARLLSACIDTCSDGDIYAIYADKLYDISTRQLTLSAAFSEACANLESAVALTSLLAPQILEAINRPAADKNNPADPNQKLELE